MPNLPKTQKNSVLFAMHIKLMHTFSACLLQVRTYGSVSVEVKKSQHKYIVGPRGQGLQEVLQTTGVWVEVPPSDSDVNTITLRGPQEKLGQALTVVSYYTATMHVP